MTNNLFEMQMSLGETLKTSGVGFMIVLCVLAVIAVLIIFISKGFNAVSNAASKSKDTDSEATPVVAAPVATPAAPVAAAPVEAPVYTRPGYLHLENLDERTAAIIMAIVSHQTGIPLNRLAFSSIKLLREELVLENTDDQTAAIIMAIVSDQTGIPLNRLDFKSIKLIEEN